MCEGPVRVTCPSAPMPRFLLPVCLATLALVLAGCDSVGLHAPPATAAVRPWPEMLAAVNAVRAEARTCGGEAFAPAPPLVWNDRLGDAARAHSADMLAHDRFEHTGSDGSRPGDRATRAGYAWRVVAENIARYQQTVPEVVADWAASPGHCRTLMDPRVAEIGAAKEGAYWTQVFGLSR